MLVAFLLNGITHTLHCTLWEQNEINLMTHIHPTCSGVSFILLRDA